MREPARSGAPLAPRSTAGIVLLALAAMAAFPACDNPACVFGPDGCAGTASGATGDVPATVPADHQWIELADPTITARIPNSLSVTLHPDSPVALVFSESLSAASLSGALRLEVAGSGGFGAPVLIATSLVADGRVLVVLPAQPLTLGSTYDLVWTDDAEPADLQGQLLEIPEDRVAGSFKVATTQPATVRLLGAFPADLSINQSGVGEFVALFDRRLNVQTVTATSFDFKVGGVEPAFDPLATPVSVTSGASTTSDTRAFRWRSIDGAGNAAPLGPGLQVDCSLSPVGSKIAAVDTSLLAPVHTRYSVASVSPALSAVIASLPSDAVGLDNLTGPATLDLQVDLTSVQDGDRLGLFLFGNSVGTDHKRIALFRELSLSAPALVVHVGEDIVDLATDQDLGRLADGTLDIAVRLQRGSVVTPLRRLDADLSVAGLQSLLLDLTRPTLTGLGTSGTNKTSFRSDLGDFSLVGRASERIRAVEVSTLLGNNGTVPAVVGSTPQGLFVAAPVLLGNLTPAQLPLAFDAQIYDNALNAAATPITATFTQVGASGPGAALPGPTIDVEVFDAATLAPITAALVMVHEDSGGLVLPVDAQLTLATGQVTLAAGLAGETLVTVDAAGYDLFTFEDVPTDRLSIPLVRTGTLPSTVGGIAGSADDDFDQFDRSIVDSRRNLLSEPLIPVGGCVFNPQSQAFECAFGPAVIRPNLLGAASLLAVEVPPSELNYNVVTFLRGFQIGIPVAPALPGALSSLKLVTTALLDDPAVVPEERAIDGPSLNLNLGSVTGVALGSLSGAPRILVEARVRGVPGSTAVGQGVAFDQGGNVWRVRSAYPGAVDGIADTPQDLLGKLVQDGVIDPDLQLSCEIRDTLGARAGRRPRLSQLGANLAPISAPTIVSPLPGAGTGGATFDLTFSNAIPDSAGTPGLYRATLQAGAGGRRWTLWRPDLNNASGATRTIHVPDLAALAGTALPDGPITAQVEAFGYAGFTASDFHWSDLEREYDAFSAGVPVGFTQP